MDLSAFSRSCIPVSNRNALLVTEEVGFLEFISHINKLCFNIFLIFFHLILLLVTSVSKLLIFLGVIVTYMEVISSVVLVILS